MLKYKIETEVSRPNSKLNPLLPWSLVHWLALYSHIHLFDKYKCHYMPGTTWTSRQSLAYTDVALKETQGNASSPAWAVLDWEEAQHRGCLPLLPGPRLSCSFFSAGSSQQNVPFLSCGIQEGSSPVERGSLEKYYWGNRAKVLWHLHPRFLKN